MNVGIILTFGEQLSLCNNFRNYSGLFSLALPSAGDEGCEFGELLVLSHAIEYTPSVKSTIPKESRMAKETAISPWRLNCCSCVPWLLHHARSM